MKYIVEKRDGTLVDFQIEKISNVIKKAFGSLHKEWDDSIIELLALRVTADFEPKKQGNRIGVEQIQDSVEKVLSESGYTEVSKAYILYRKQRENVRKLVEGIQDPDSLISSYLASSNAGSSLSNPSMEKYIISTLIHHFWMDEIFDEEIRQALKEKKIAINHMDTLKYEHLNFALSTISLPKDPAEKIVRIFLLIGDLQKYVSNRLTIIDDTHQLEEKEIDLVLRAYDDVQIKDKPIEPDQSIMIHLYDADPKSIELAQRIGKVRQEVLDQLKQIGFFQCKECDLFFDKPLESTICFDQEEIRPFEKEQGFRYIRKKVLDGDDLFTQLDQEVSKQVSLLFDDVEYTASFADLSDGAAIDMLEKTIKKNYPFINSFGIRPKT